MEMKRSGRTIMCYFLVFLAAQRLTRLQIVHDIAVVVFSAVIIVLFCYLLGSMEMRTSIQAVLRQS